MSVVKRFNPLKNLDELDVLIDDVNTSSHIVITDMPQSLPQGKSSFLIETGPYMKEGIELQFDFVDNEGESIYLEPVAEYLEGTSRRISIEVYNDTAPGTANLIVVGELDEVPTAPGLFADTEPVPEEFQGVYNVRLTREVIINPVAVNTQPIRFYTQPQIRVSERRLGTMERTDPPDKIQTSPFSVEGVPADGFAFKEFGTEEPKQGALAETSTKIIQSKGKTSKFSRMKKSFKAKKGKRKFSLFKRAGHIAKFNSPEQFPFSFKTSAHSFTTKEIDGSIILTSIDSTKYNQDQFAELKLTYPPTLNSAHTMSIEDIGNGSTAFVTKPFTQINADQQEIILPFFGTAKTLFEPPPTASYSTVNIVSYADVLIDRMRTFSGDVFKTKVYVRPEGSFDDFKVLAELPVEAGELLVDPNSVGRGERTGYFENQADINQYWDKFGGTNGNIGTAPEFFTVTMNYNNDIVLDAVKLSGSLATFTDQMRYQLKSAYKFQLKAGIDYNLTFNAYGKKGVNKRALLLPYISGSSMYASSTEFSDEVTQNKVIENSNYGKRLGALEILTDDDDEVDFKSVTTEFVPDRNGDAIVQFRNVEGEWYISDISVSPATDTGFSPSFFTFEKEMPPEFQHKRPETFEFMVEFYDSNNNIADSIAFNSGSTFDGANAFMSGNDNTMAGSLFIGGDTTSSGMHFGGVSSTIPETGGAGAQGSGFMRSVGYQGFISASNPSLAGTFGFMIYSGSVLPDSGDNYAGVGLELIGASGSLKFRTNPSVFEVQADAFFVGKTTTQFISGSGGQIEISSSGFHLRPAGEVTASSILLGDKDNNQFLQFDDGQLTVQGNLSVDNIRTPALINGSPSNVLNASSSIDSQGFASFKSASIAGFVVNPIAIHSADKSLILSGSGNITGSNVLFSGGKVANWEISGDKLQSINSSDKGIILDADVSTPIITVQEDSNNKIEVYHTTSTNWGLKGISGGNTVFRLGNSNQIAGWTIGNSTIEGGNLILGKDGFVKSADYITDTSGFIISAEDNGFAEFENVKIRGTLATTTFEKESVNAVGGQLFVANSAAMTGSNVPTTGSKFTLKNVTGFTKGEILLIKKVTDNGFNTEYVKVVSSSRTNEGGDDDPDGLAGDLFVERGQGYYVRAKKEYVADNDNNGELRVYTGVKPLAYVSPGQNFDTGDQNGFNVTGGHTHSGSFHVFLTGSVSQVGTDLVSAQLRLLNNSNGDSVIGTKEFWAPGDGTGNVSKDLFFEHNTLTPSPSGSKIKMQLRITGDGTDDSYFIMNKMTASLDYGTIGTPDLFGDASGSVGDPIGGPESYTEGQVLVSTGRYISGTGTNTVGTGYIRLNANPKNKATPYMDIVERTGSGIYDIELKARVGDLSGVAGTRNVPEGFNGFGIMSEVAFLSGSNIKLEAPAFLLGDKNANFVSGSGGKMEISSSKFHIKPDGDLVVKKVNADEGTVGGFTLGENTLTATNFELDPSGKRVTLGSGNSVFIADGDEGIQLGHATFGSAPFRVTTAGALTATSATVTGDINADTGTFGGSSNGFTIETSKLHNSHNSSFLGLVDADAAHADVGSVSAFYAGATAATGEGAGISFGSDGIIRGTGVYSRNSKEFLIGAETIFGDGRDGDIRISFAGTSIQIWNNTTNSAPTHTYNNTGDVTSVTYGDVIMSKLSSADDETLTLQRDLYVRTLILDIDTDKGKIDCNGFRIFASEGIFIHCDSNSTNTAFIFRNNGSDGSDGGAGGAATDSDATGGSVPAATAGSSGAGGAEPFTGGTLVSPGAGAAGGAGCSGGPVDLSGGIDTNFTSTATAGAAGINPTDGLSNANPMISNFSGTTGGSGGSGGASNLGAGGSSAGGAGAGGSLVQAGIQWFSTPADSIVKFRAEYGTNDYPARLTTMPGNSAGGGGGGGRGGVDGAAGNFAGGGAGGGGGGAGSSGGPICIVAKVIDWWQTAKYSANVTSPGNNTGHHGFIVCKSIAGDGGNGGNGSNGGSNGASGGGGGGGGGGGAGGNGGTILIVTSNLTPTTSNPLGTLTTAHTITDPDDSSNKLTYDTFQATTNAGGNDIGMKSTGGSGGNGGSAGSAGGAGSSAAGTAGSAGNDGKEGPCPVIII